jgi:hypothetical protein
MKNLVVFLLSALALPSSVAFAAKIVDGSCGAANGAAAVTAPTTNLCRVGMVSSVTGTGPWYWSCTGNRFGSTARCSAPLLASPVNGACGSSNGLTLSTAPTTDLCSIGAASSVGGTGPWSWSCEGSDGGTTASCSAATATRDPLIQPFSSTSIWNMPIGSGAIYVPANLPAVPGGYTWAPMPKIDEERIILRPLAPVAAIFYNGAGWSGANRCSGSGSPLASVPIPSEYIVPNDAENESATYLLADNRTIVQSQPLARCSAGSYATSLVVWPPIDIHGDGIPGAHGGSNLSAFGGSLRVGEMRAGGQAPHHALKVIVDATVSLYKCTTTAQCYRWPASTADGYAIGWYGSKNPSQSAAVKMGALLAIPSSVDISTLGLETEPGKMLAWTLQNYGAYIVDDTYQDGFGFAIENGPNGSFRSQFLANYGFDFPAVVRDDTPWVRDNQRLVRALSVVDNNGPDSIGGGGTPRQPLALPLQ